MTEQQTTREPYLKYQHVEKIAAKFLTEDIIHKVKANI